MKINLHARFKFSDPYGEWHGSEGVATHNCYLADRAGWIRRKQARIDLTTFITNDNSRYILTNKKNVEGVRK